MKCTKESYLLYAVTDRTWLNGRSLAEAVEAALAGGITFLQLREKELSEEAFLAEALQLRELTRRYQVPFVINDSLAVALAADADGIHVGQSDLDAAAVRAQLPAGKLLGVSVQTVAQAIQAEQAGADYLGVGAMHATSTKTDADIVSRATLQAITAAVSIPVVAIGGIDAYNIMELSGTGLDGVALVSAIFAAPDITAASRHLLALAKEMVAG